LPYLSKVTRKEAAYGCNLGTSASEDVGTKADYLTIHRTFPYLLAFVLMSCLASSLPALGQAAQSSATVLNRTQYVQTLFEDFEGNSPNPGLNFSPSAITHVPGETIAGSGSLKLAPGGLLSTNGSILPLQGNTYYAIQFDYKIVNVGNLDGLIFVDFRPANSTDSQTFLVPPQMLKNTETSGTFSTGSLLGSASAYQVELFTQGGATLIIDNFRIIRHEITAETSPPRQWNYLNVAPFPRLMKVIQPTTDGLVQGFGSLPPFYYTRNQIEQGAAFADIIGNYVLGNQSADPDFARRMRTLNPNIVILPGVLASETFNTIAPTNFGNTSINNDYVKSLRLDWIVKNSSGNPAADQTFGNMWKMDFSQFCPMLGGTVFNDVLINFVSKGFSSGLWDGSFFDNLFGRINPNILNYDKPELLDFDVNRNGKRDETPGYVSELTRAGESAMLQSLRSKVANNQLVVGNSGSNPDAPIAPYLNGFYWECVGDSLNESEATWRRIFDDYMTIDQLTRAPHINMLEGCGRFNTLNGSRSLVTYNSADLVEHRLTLGTTLLGNGFYMYDLVDSGSPPFWFDEFSVAPTGIAVRDLAYKGYLGQALGTPAEIAGPGTLIWSEDFESGTFPQTLSSRPGVRLSQDPSEVISGNGSLVLENTTHASTSVVSVSTIPNRVPIVSGQTYFVQFDWRVLSSLDLQIYSSILGSGVVGYGTNGPVTGDSGTARFPVTVTSGTNLSLQIQIVAGGKVSVDNIRIYAGGVGPWRRDFENGLVIVNPLNQTITLSASDVAGRLGRTGIKRILGTQAPDVNNGQPLGSSLTLQPMDALILLADKIPAPWSATEIPFSVSNGAQSVVATADALSVGYAKMSLDVGRTAADGLAIFSYTQGGVLVSEATVPATAPVSSGRIRAVTQGAVRTGIAIANPGSSPASINFYFTDESGANVRTASSVVLSGAHLAAFLDEAPFLSGANFTGTLTFTSTIPVAVIALRGYTNEKSEFLLTTIPVAPLYTANLASTVLPHFANGGGWNTEVVLVNPSDQMISGAVQFVSPGSATSPSTLTISVNGQSANSFAYNIPPRAGFSLKTDGSGQTITSGSVYVNPLGGSVVPSALAIFSFTSGGVVVSQASVISIPAAQSFRMYAETGDGNSNIQPGFAVANNSTKPVTVNLQLFSVAGTPTGFSGQVVIPPQGQVASFLNGINGFQSVPNDFKGVLEISASSPIYAMGLRGRYNQRGDFLITSTQPVDESTPPSTAPLYFPHVAAGGGFSTQIILFNASAGQLAGGSIQIFDNNGAPLTLKFSR
jgi:hypothetical protein